MQFCGFLHSNLYNKLLSIVFIARISVASYSSFFSVGYLKSESYIIKKLDVVKADERYSCAAKCLALIVESPDQWDTCNAFQYDGDTLDCQLLVIPSVIVDTTSGNGVRVLFNVKTVAVVPAKLKANLKAFWTLIGDKNGHLDISSNNNVLSLKDSYAFQEKFELNQQALRLNNGYGEIIQDKNSLTVRGESVTVCFWYKNYDEGLGTPILTWRYNYRYTTQGSCKRSKTKCDLNDACNLVCKANCEKACLLCICLDLCRYNYIYYVGCPINVPSFGILVGIYGKGLEAHVRHSDHYDRKAQRSRPMSNGAKWNFYCSVIKPEGNFAHYKNAKKFGIDGAHNYNGHQQYNDLRVMTDEPLYIGRWLFDENKLTEPETRINGAIAYLQIYIGEEFEKEDIEEAMKLSAQRLEED